MSDFLSKFTNLFSDRVSQPAKPRPEARKPPTNRRLHLEPLEERTMLCASLCPQPDATLLFDSPIAQTAPVPFAQQESALLPEFIEPATTDTSYYSDWDEVLYPGPWGFWYFQIPLMDHPDIPQMSVTVHEKSIIEANPNDEWFYVTMEIDLTSYDFVDCDYMFLTSPDVQDVQYSSENGWTSPGTYDQWPYSSFNVSSETVQVRYKPANNSKPQSDRDALFTSVGYYYLGWNRDSGIMAHGWRYMGTDYTGHEILDDDKWILDVEATGETAVERMPDVPQSPGYFEFTRTHSGTVPGDRSYGIPVDFDMLYDSGNPHGPNNMAA